MRERPLGLHVRRPRRRQSRVLQQRRLGAPRSREASRDVRSLAIPSWTPRCTRLFKSAAETAPLAAADSMRVRSTEGLADMLM